MVVFGSLGVADGKVSVYGYLFDAKNQQTPQILGKQYSDNASVDNARAIAHRFADEIITRLGGIAGICETKIYFVSFRTGNKEIWLMDYDGQNEHQITHLGSISLSPRVAPDNSRVAFSSLGKNGWSIHMYSLLLNRMVNFNSPGGTTISPAWSSDGSKLAFSSAHDGDSEIYTTDANGGGLHRVTAFHGPDVSPVGERAHGAAADLHHGFRRRQRATPDRWRLCHFAFVVTQWAVSCLCLEPQVWAGRAGRAGHLHHGHCQQALDAADT
jgi:TolB protein